MANQYQNSLPEIPISQPKPSLPISPNSVLYEFEMVKGRKLRDYLHILLRRKWFIIVPFVTIFLLVAIYTFTRTPIYQTKATLMITQDNPGSSLSPADRSNIMMGFSYLEKFQKTQYKILESQAMATRVIKALNLGDHPDYSSIKNAPNMEQAEIEEAMANLFRAKLGVVPVENSYLVNISYESPDKFIVPKVINAIANEFMYLAIDCRNQSFDLVKNWLNKQLQDIGDKVQSAQNQLYRFGQKTDIYMVGDKDNVINQKFIELNGLLTKAQAERIAKEAQYKQIKEKGTNAPFIVNNPLIAELRQQVVSQQAKVAAKRRIYLDGHPEMQAELSNLAEMKNRLQVEIQRIQDSVKADYEAAQRAENLLQESFDEQKKQMAKLQENLIQYQIIKRDAEANEQLYQALLARVKEANISSTMVPTNIQVIDPGKIGQLYKPKKLRDLTLGGLIGLLFGIGLALLVDNLDDSIKSSEDLEACRFPSLGLLPLIRKNGTITSTSTRKNWSLAWLWRKHLSRLRLSPKNSSKMQNFDMIVYQNPRDPFTEALRQTQISIMLSVSGHAPSTILITSANPSEGKTTFVCNLASLFALDGAQTVVVDCDLRKPRVHKSFQVNPQPGLTNYLTGGATLDEILKSTPIPNLTVIPAGPISPSPANLLNSEIFKDMLIYLRSKFRHVIIDTPPMVGFSDARILAVMVDGVVMVTKYKVTHKLAVNQANQLLSQINVPIIGAVINCVDKSSLHYGGYNYKYYSRYYDMAK